MTEYDEQLHPLPQRLDVSRRVAAGAFPIEIGNFVVHNAEVLPNPDAQPGLTVIRSEAITPVDNPDGTVRSVTFERRPNAEDWSVIFDGQDPEGHDITYLNDSV